MTNKKLFSLLLMALFALTIVNGPQFVSAKDIKTNDSPTSHAQKFKTVTHLTKWLEQQGYELSLEKSTTNHFSDNSFGASHDQVALTTVLLPFLDQDGESARVAYWNGYWNKTFVEGAIAVINDSDIYVLNEQSRIASLDLKSLPTHFDFPIYALPGSPPPDIDPLEIKETRMRSGCKQIDVSRGKYSTLGFSLFRFHQIKNFCYDFNRVHSVSMTTKISNMDIVAVYNGIVSSWENNYGSSHDSTRQAHIQLCALGQIGCYANYYPAVTIHVYSNGHYTPW